MKTKHLLLSAVLLCLFISSPVNAGGKTVVLEWLAVRMGLISERTSAEAILKMYRPPALPERMPLNSYGAPSADMFGMRAPPSAEAGRLIRELNGVDFDEWLASDNKITSRLFREHPLEQIGEDSGLATEASKANESVVKLGLDGKLEIGTLYSSKYLSVKGGEINVLRWGAAAGGAAYCKSKECFSEAVKKAIELDEKFGLKGSAKPSELPD